MSAARRGQRVTPQAGATPTATVAPRFPSLLTVRKNVLPQQICNTGGHDERA